MAVWHGGTTHRSTSLSHQLVSMLRMTMQETLNRWMRAVSGAALATLLSVSLLACSTPAPGPQSFQVGLWGDTGYNTFEKQAMTKIGLIESIIPRYRSTYFSHIFSGGYSSGYYSYIWSGVLDTDAFEAFKITTLFNPEKAKSFRKNVLEKGGTEDPMVLYKRFRGAEPSIEPLLRKRGLDKKEETPVKKFKG